MGDAYFNSFFRQVARDARQDFELSKWISRSTIGEKIWRWPCTTLNCSWTSRWAKWTRWSISSSLLPWETVWISKLKWKNRKSPPSIAARYGLTIAAIVHFPASSLCLLPTRRNSTHISCVPASCALAQLLCIASTISSTIGVEWRAGRK